MVKSTPDFRKPISKLLIIIISIIGIYCFILEHFVRNKISSGLIFSSILIIFIGGLMINFVIKNNIPFDAIGITLNKWKLSIKEAALWSFYFIVLAIFVKFLYYTYYLKLESTPLLSFNVFSKLGALKSVSFILTYVVLSFIQEISRCVIQGSLNLFFESKYSSVKSILLTSLLFSSFHLIINPYFAYGAFFTGIFWGVLFARTPSVIGVTISHILLGVFFFYFDYFPISDLVTL